MYLKFCLHHQISVHLFGALAADGIARDRIDCCYTRWNCLSQRVGQSVPTGGTLCLPYIIALYVSQGNYHFGCIHRLHRYLHRFSTSLPVCYVLVYVVYANFKNKISCCTIEGRFLRLSTEKFLVLRVLCGEKSATATNLSQ